MLTPTVALGVLSKEAGDNFGASLTFKHTGPGGNAFVGIGIAYGKTTGHNAPFSYAVRQVQLTEDTTTKAYSVDVAGIMPPDLEGGQTLDAQRFISDTEPVGGQQPPNPYDVNNWDDDVYQTAGIAPTYKLLEETIYPYAYVYDGEAEVHTFTFKTDPFTPASWVKGKLASNVESQVKKAGGRIMELRVYVDQTPLLWNNWMIEAVVQAPAATAGLGMSLGIAWFAVAILAVLAIILIIVLTWAVKTVVSLFTHKGINEDIKKAWSKETLISAIGDFEVKLKRTPTPTADLEKKSDDELRTYCDELATAVAPTAGGAGVAMIVIAAGVLGLGALAIGAYAMSQKKETKKAISKPKETRK